MFDWLFRRNTYNLPPGPWSWPLLGTLRVLRAKFWYEEIAELTKVYGPVVRVYLGPKMVIVLNDLKSVKEALVDRNSDFSNRPNIASGILLSDSGNDIAFSNYSPQWKALKDITNSSMRKYLEDDHRLETIVHLSVTKVLTLMTKEGGSFNPMKYIDKIIFSVMCHVILGTCEEPDDPNFDELMELMLYACTSGNLREDRFPFLLNMYKSQEYCNREVALIKLFNIIQLKIEEHRDTLNPDNMRDLLDYMIMEWRHSDTPMHYLKTVILNVFAGGLINPSRVMYFTVRYMAQLQNMQRKVQDELDNVVGQSRMPLVSDIDNLPRCLATVYECMRLGASPCLGVPHLTRCDTKIGEYDIPHDTLVFINTWYIHRNPEDWFNPLEFNPDRFLTADNKIRNLDCLSIFSRGDRFCLGGQMALKTFPLILSCILQRFTLKLAEGADPELKFAGSHFVTKPEDFEIILEERK